MLIRLSEHLKVVDALSKPHQGTVVDNDDPKKLGRVKCTIPGIMEASADDLPWISSEYDPAKFDVPEIGAVLKVNFEFGDIYSGNFTGYWHSEANHVSDFDADYPNTFGFVKQGFKFLINKTSQLLTFVHPSGTTLNADADGNVLMSIANDWTAAIAGKLGFSADGDIELTSQANVKIEASTNVDIKGTAAVSIESDAQASFKGAALTEIGSPASPTNVNGAVVLLAGGGPAVALLGSRCIGPGNLGAPVVSYIVEGSTRVLAGP